MASIRRQLTFSTVDEVLKALGIDPDTPTEWATVDRCLTWLRERRWCFLGEAWWNGDGYEVMVYAETGSGLTGQYNGIGLTFHAALIAACQAVVEAQP